jgi:hypothetical protein
MVADHLPHGLYVDTVLLCAHGEADHLNGLTGVLVTGIHVRLLGDWSSGRGNAISAPNAKETGRKQSLSFKYLWGAQLQSAFRSVAPLLDLYVNSGMSEKADSVVEMHQTLCADAG